MWVCETFTGVFGIYNLKINIEYGPFQNPSSHGLEQEKKPLKCYEAS